MLLQSPSKHSYKINFAKILLLLHTIRKIVNKICQVSAELNQAFSTWAFFHISISFTTTYINKSINHAFTCVCFYEEYNMISTPEQYLLCAADFSRSVTVCLLNLFNLGLKVIILYRNKLNICNWSILFLERELLHVLRTFIYF